MTVSLDIPYKSQMDPDADESRNDCGAACVAMLLNALGKPVSTNAVFRKTGAGSEAYISTAQLRRASEGFGVALDWHVGLSLGHLIAYLNLGRPLIALVHYGVWSERGLTESKFTGPHFVVVTGFDEHNIYLHDPLFTQERRAAGANRVFTKELFMKAWGSAHLDCWAPNQCNPDFGALVPTSEHSVPTLRVPIDMLRRIRAYAVYAGHPLPNLTHLASLTAWSAAVGDWGRKFVTHKVHPQDTLESLAEGYYGAAKYASVIALFNALELGDTIYDNGVLWIPEPHNPDFKPDIAGGFVPPRSPARRGGSSLVNQ